MMPDLGKYSDTVLLSWGATLVLLGALIVVTVVQSRRAARALSAQETRMRARND
ncbi:heme exporter protein CcmD [Rhodobacteraceae bacterium]|nr:heme exporter protein CcmD [Paracoccaceae bacterium]